MPRLIPGDSVAGPATIDTLTEAQAAAASAFMAGPWLALRAAGHLPADWASLPPEGPAARLEAFRFLAARDWDPAAAAAMLRGAAALRVQSGVDVGSPFPASLPIAAAVDLADVADFLAEEAATAAAPPSASGCAAPRSSAAALTPRLAARDPAADAAGQFYRDVLDGTYCKGIAGFTRAGSPLFIERTGRIDVHALVKRAAAFVPASPPSQSPSPARTPPPPAQPSRSPPNVSLPSHRHERCSPPLAPRLVGGGSPPPPPSFAETPQSRVSAPPSRGDGASPSAPQGSPTAAPVEAPATCSGSPGVVSRASTPGSSTASFTSPVPSAPATSPHPGPPLPGPAAAAAAAPADSGAEIPGSTSATRGPSVASAAATAAATPLPEVAPLSPLVAYHQHCNEAAARLVRYSNARVAGPAGRRVTGATMVLDLSGMGLRQIFPPAFALVKRWVELDHDFYPEGLERIVIANAPRAFPMAWAIVQRWLSKADRERVEVLAPKATETRMAELADRALLPASLGGTAADEEVWPAVAVAAL